MTDICTLSAAELAASIRKKATSAREVVEAHLARIRRLNPGLNALIAVDEERALEAARRCDQALAAGEPPGPLCGVPITIKSSIDVAGLRCEAGTRLRKGYVAAADAPLVRRLKSAGAIVLGNTNTPELLMAYETDNLLYGRTNSPWDARRTPGGSSGGEAAAIAAGLSAGGVGSDGGGSIRIPAHFSGICGLKPTPGRIPATGHFPSSLGPFALIGVVGPMARTVGDLRLMFQAMAGPDDGDPSSAPVAGRWPGDEELRAIRVGVMTSHPSAPVTPETEAAVHRAAQALAHQGLIVEEFTPPDLERARALWWNIFGRAGALVLGPMLAGREAELSPILTEFRAMVERDAPITATELIETTLQRDLLRGQLLGSMQRWRVLLTPVCSIPAFRHGERQWSVDGQTVEYLQAMAYTQWFNILGNPAVVVPVGRSPEGLPIGVQIVGRPYEEETVLAVAESIESACGAGQRPPITD
jgi:Asp-tRNA(Asn)/Glu-tRNA(Gln) amidotransferase A subunit family amidase